MITLPTYIPGPVRAYVNVYRNISTIGVWVGGRS